MSFQEEYNGHVVFYSEFDSKWIARIGDSESKHATPDLCRKKIDSVLKNDFIKFDAIIKHSSWCDKYIICTVTSINGDEAWVSVNGSRSKKTLSDLYILDDKSKAAINENDVAIAKFDSIVDLADKEKKSILSKNSSLFVKMYPISGKN